MMSISRRMILGLVGWAGALYAVLSLSSISGNWGHTICGPWGCGPPLQALLGCHGFWVLLLTPPAIMAIRRWSGRTLQQAGIALGIVAVLGLVGIVVWDSVTWLPKASDWHRQYLIERCLFVVATLVDVPLVPLSLIGIAFGIAGSIRSRNLAEQNPPAKDRNDHQPVPSEAGIVE